MRRKQTENEDVANECHVLSDTELMQRLMQSITSTIGRGWFPDSFHAEKSLDYLQELIKRQTGAAARN